MSSPSLRRQFGHRIRELRLASGLNQEAFADKCGFARTYMSRIETGGANPSLDAIKTLADALGVELAELFRGLQQQTTIQPRRATPLSEVIPGATVFPTEPSMIYPHPAIQLLDLLPVLFGRFITEKDANQRPFDSKIQWFRSLGEQQASPFILLQSVIFSKNSCRKWVCRWSRKYASRPTVSRLSTLIVYCCSSRLRAIPRFRYRTGPEAMIWLEENW